MLKQLFLPISLTSALWRLSIANPVDPTITPAAVLPRQRNDPNFIGWFLETSGSTSLWTTGTCPSGAYWSQANNYAACCPTSIADCYTATACFVSSGQGYQVVTAPALTSSWTIACTSNYKDTARSLCNTISVFERYGQEDSNPQINIYCGSLSAKWTYYRTIPPSLTEHVSSSPTSISQVTPTTTSASSTPTPKPESESKAWIAGAVAGPILGLVLIGAGVWLFLRRKKKAAHTPPAGVGGYTDAKPQYQSAQHAYPSPTQGQAYAQQGDFSPPQISPAPQYGFQSPYNTIPSPHMGH